MSEKSDIKQILRQIEQMKDEQTAMFLILRSFNNRLPPISNTDSTLVTEGYLRRTIEQATSDIRDSIRQDNCEHDYQYQPGMKTHKLGAIWWTCKDCGKVLEDKPADHHLKAMKTLGFEPPMAQTEGAEE